MKTIIVDPSLCIQCCDCQIACKDEHCDNDWSPIAAPQSEGQFWVKITESQAASGTRMRQNRIPVMCQQCKDAPCLKAAKDDAAYRRDDGIIIFDPEKSRGQKAIMEACPYHAVYWNEALDIPQKCTMCAHLLDAGWEQPRCVAACPRDALRFVDTDELADVAYAPIERLHHKYKTHPSVAYLNLPKPFIAGSVYAAGKERLLDRVRIVAKSDVTGEESTAETNFLGEFRVTCETDGFYTLTVDKPGFDKKTIARLDVRGGKNVGDIALYATPAYTD